MRKSILFLMVSSVLVLVGYYCFKGFSIQYIIQEKDLLLHYINNHYVASVITFFLVSIGAVFSGLPITAVIGMAGGLLFGLYEGGIYTILSSTLGAVLSFFVIKYFLGNFIQNKYGPKLERFNKNFESYGGRYLLILHIMMVIPFFLINVFAALTRVSFWTFLWTTVVGLVPAVILYTYAGNQLQHVEEVSDIFTWPIILTFVCIAGLILFSIFSDRFKKKF